MAHHTLNTPALAQFRAMMGAGRPFDCLVALMLLAPASVSTQLVADLTEQSRQSARVGLRKLELMRLAANFPVGPTDNWLLTEQASQLPLVVALVAENAMVKNLPLGDAENAMVKNLPLGDAENAMVKNLPLPAPDSGKVKNLPLPAPEEEEYILSSSSGDNDSAPKPYQPMSAADLKAAMLKIFVAGRVFANVRASLVATLAEEAPDFLPHLLGHLAKLKSGQMDGYDKGHKYLIDMAASKTELAPSELPPAELSFSAALRWALNGGHTDAELAEAARQQKLADAEADAELAQAQREHAAQSALEAQARAASALARVPDESVHQTIGPTSPITYAALWQAALGQLQLELPRITFDAWLAEAALISVRDGAALTIAVATAHQRDWLANRLTANIQRTLAGFAGRALTVTFVAAETQRA